MRCPQHMPFLLLLNAAAACAISPKFGCRDCAQALSSLHLKLYHHRPGHAGGLEVVFREVMMLLGRK